MKIMPVSSNNIFPLKNLSFKASSSTNLASSEEIISPVRIVSTKDRLLAFEVANKNKASNDMRAELSRLEIEDISPETRKARKEDIEVMKASIVDSCINFDEYKDKRFSYDDTMEHFSAWHDYVTQKKDYLSEVMTTPYEIVKKERVSIASFSKENPNSKDTEILQSRIYKMYMLLKLNKQHRNHFHD